MKDVYFWHVAMIFTSLASFLAAADYRSQATASPVKVFEQSYAIDYPAQSLEAGTYYTFGGGTRDAYFIYYPFEDGSTHLVRVPVNRDGEELMRREGRQVRVVKSFLFTFTHGSVLFNPRHDYPVIEEAAGKLLLKVPADVEQMEVEADRFQIKRQLVSHGESPNNTTAEEAASIPMTSYLLSHPPVNNLPVVKDAVEGICVIETPEGKGTGFLFGMEGRVFCVTNHHVLGSGDDLRISASDGREFTPLYFEVAKDRDLARILLKEMPPSFQSFGKAKLEETIKVLGNSGGAGVVTFDEGKVIGHGPKVIEVDSDFIAGNSGSPLLTEANEVAGVATYIVSADQGEEDWVAEKTRFVKARRFATRFDETVEWEQVDKRTLQRGAKAVEMHEVFIHEMVELLISFAQQPQVPIGESVWTNTKLRSWVRQTNILNQQFAATERGFAPKTQIQYDTAIRQFTTDRINGYLLQIRRLNHITKRQLAQLRLDERSLPEAGYYPQHFEELRTQYEFLIEGMAYTSDYIAEAVRYFQEN